MNEIRNASFLRRDEKYSKLCMRDFCWNSFRSVKKKKRNVLSTHFETFGFVRSYGLFHFGSNSLQIRFRKMLFPRVPVCVCVFRRKKFQLWPPPLKGILIRMAGEQYQTKLKFLAREHEGSTGLGRPVKVFTRFEPTCLNRAGGNVRELRTSIAPRCLLGRKKPLTTVLPHLDP